MDITLHGGPLDGHSFAITDTQHRRGFVEFPSLPGIIMTERPEPFAEMSVPSNVRYKRDLADPSGRRWVHEI